MKEISIFSEITKEQGSPGQNWREQPEKINAEQS